jgi:hypothetical protein
MKASLTQPALIGGLVGGVLSALPLVSGGNLCCCLWVVSGGVVAAYLLQQNQTAPIVASDGALVGLLAGVVGAFVYLVVSIPINLLMPAGTAHRPASRRDDEQHAPEFGSYATRSTAPVCASRGGRQLHLHAVSRGGFSTIGGLLGLSSSPRRRRRDHRRSASTRKRSSAAVKPRGWRRLLRWRVAQCSLWTIESRR